MSPTNDSIEFVQQVDIATQHGQGEGNTARIISGSAITFVNGVSGQMKADVTNSTLFAQLAADKRYSRQDQATEWYSYYKDVLENVGWIVSNFDFVEQRDVNSYGTVDKLILKLAELYSSPSEYGSFNTMIGSLKDAKNNEAVGLFNSSSKAGRKANFQTGVVSNSDGNPVVKIGVYHYSTTQDIDNVLFFTFGSQKVNLFAGNQTMVLNTDIYNQVRQAVLDKLGSTSRDLVKDIQI